MIYFASDVHLGAGTPEEQRATEQRFVAWLDRVAADAEAIYLLGDLFDFWFEYQRVAPQGFVRTLGRLAALADKGVRIVFFTGNHDMWVGEYLTRECGVEVVTAPRVEELYGKHYFLAHGDHLRVKRFSLLWLMNTVFRSRVLRWLFRWLVHPDWALRFGRWWSGKSRKSHAKTALEPRLTESLRDYAHEHAASHPDVSCYIFGHMHVACSRLEEQPRVLHLGCWEQTPTYASLDESGCLKLETFTL